MPKLPAPPANNDNSIWQLFGQPPVLKGEDGATFKALLNRLAEDLAPIGIIEHGWIWDAAYLTWEIRRYRNAALALQTLHKHRGLKMILDTIYGREQSQNVAERWALREPEAIALVDDLLKLAGLTMEDVAAQTLSVVLNDIERLDGLTARAETRRNLLYAEIGRRHATFSADLRRSVGGIEDGEFTELPTSGKNASGTA